MNTVVLPFEGRLFWAAAPAAFHESPLLHLVSGIYALEAGQARRILRAPFFQTHPFNARDYGLMKVAAKRGAHDPAQVGAWLARADLERVDLSGALAALPAPPEGPFPADAMAAARALRDAVAPSEKLHLRDRPVGCVIVDEAGGVLAAERNRGAGNRVLHAELLAVLRHGRTTGRKLPRGARVYTTLKPCRMCAGFLWDGAEDPRGLRVEYLEFDPGRNARVTILDDGSPERTRF